MTPSSIKNWDQTLFTIINSTHHPLWDQYFKWVTHTLCWLPLYIFLFFFIRKNIGWKGIMLFSLTIIISDQCSASLLKPLFERYRPYYEVNMQWVHLVGEHKGIYGFPSSHASNTFSFAMLFWKIFKRKYNYTYLFFIWAIIISYGRVYGGMHYPLDVIFGAILGIFIGLLIYHCYSVLKSPLS
jgi:undecaprenyl-diphosphatase